MLHHIFLSLHLHLLWSFPYLSFPYGLWNAWRQPISFLAFLPLLRFSRPALNQYGLFYCRHVFALELIFSLIIHFRLSNLNSTPLFVRALRPQFLLLQLHCSANLLFFRTSHFLFCLAFLWTLHQTHLWASLNACSSWRFIVQFTLNNDKNIVNTVYKQFKY